ncbi:MAG: hypothetical protein PWQ14_334 [Rikenellaceae bacterium]|nr:hypothetical protein [Rikenellaceae bacterium]
MSYLTEKAIGELLEFNFFIPSYQRGFRWSERQVEDLLEDINAFVPTQIEKSDKKTWYCLQPVVVKECDERTKIENDLQGTWYEVIDGQQRLTSIFLIIHYANEMWVGKQKIPEFQLKYETRESSFQFLKQQKINELNDQAEIDYENIDYYNISVAYNTIHNWVKNYKSKFNKDFDNNDFQSKLKSYTKVIWYEVSSEEKDAIEIFTRINMGKIPLTNAELIKALFLNSSNFPNSDTEKIRLRQLEIASEWDRIEYSLQNDELWYFINNSENELPTRIEYIFNIIYWIAKEEFVKEEGGKTFDEKYGKDEYSTFRFFSDKFKTNTKDEIDNNWKEIKRTFQTIEEWFEDRELYHKVGFLITAGEKITELLNNAQKRQKNDFKKFLDSKITEKVKCDNLKELEYGKDNLRIKNILLLHNILTMLSNENETSRFPFDRFKKEKKEKWDIEHIHAIATEMPKNKQHRIDWLNNSKEYINEDENLASSISDFVNSYDEKIKENPESFDELANLVLDYYSKKSNVETEINDLSNLVLLDSGTNRSYKNAVFPVKRKIIINKEKEGTFIPICTKNVFLKYYTPDPVQMTFWDDNDMRHYFENIKAILYK